MAEGRRKGKVAEREVAEILRSYDFEASRDGRLDTDLKHNVAGVHFEVKRRERLDIPAWTRQAVADAKDGEMPVVVYRRSREPWMAVLPFESLLELLR